jgi:hypothetical protein
MALKDTEREIDRLEADIKKLELEYNLFFAGRSAKPPWEARAKVEAAVKKLDRTPIQHTATRFRFTTVQTRFVALVELWERTQRSREEGRALPPGGRKHEDRAAQHPSPGHQRPGEDTRFAVTLSEPHRERQALTALYDALSAARREAGVADVPFPKFEAMVMSQIGKVRAAGGGDVAFRVYVKDGKAHFTARSASSQDSESSEGGDSRR